MGPNRIGPYVQIVIVFGFMCTICSFEEERNNNLLYIEMIQVSFRNRELDKEDEDHQQALSFHIAPDCMIFDTSQKFIISMQLALLRIPVYRT